MQATGRHLKQHPQALQLEQLVLEDFPVASLPNIVNSFHHFDSR